MTCPTLGEYSLSGPNWLEGQKFHWKRSQMRRTLWAQWFPDLPVPRPTVGKTPCHCFARQPLWKHMCFTVVTSHSQRWLCGPAVMPVHACAPGRGCSPCPDGVLWITVAAVLGSIHIKNAFQFVTWTLPVYASGTEKVPRSVLVLGRKPRTNSEQPFKKYCVTYALMVQKWCSIKNHKSWKGLAS